MEEYDRFWIVGESIITRIYGGGGRDLALKELIYLISKGERPVRMLGDHDSNLVDITEESIQFAKERAVQETARAMHLTDKGEQILREITFS